EVGIVERRGLADLERRAVAVTTVLARRRAALGRLLVDQQVAVRVLDREVQIGAAEALDEDRRGGRRAREARRSAGYGECAVVVGRDLAEQIVLQPVAIERAHDQTLQARGRAARNDAAGDDPHVEQLERVAPLARQNRVIPARALPAAGGGPL